MTEMKHLPETYLQEASVYEDIPNLVTELKPHWSTNDLQITELGGGVSCLLFRCSTTNQALESITIRIWKMFENTPYANHQFELEVIQEASKCGLFPPLLATFGNGYCYTYIPGETMFKAAAKDFVVDETVIGFVAKTMASIHSLKVPKTTLNQPTFFKQMLDSLDQVTFPLMSPSPTVKVWKEEVKALEHFLGKQGDHVTVCHGDPHPGNIIWCEGKDGIMFLDWEFTHMGYGTVDMAYFLSSFEYKDYESLFAKHYLRQNFDLNGRKGEPVTDQDISELKKKIKIFSLGVWLRFIVHHICFPDISRIATSDVEATLQYFLDRYQAIRQEVMGSPSLGQSYSQ